MNTQPQVRNFFPPREYSYKRSNSRLPTEALAKVGGSALTNTIQSFESVTRAILLITVLFGLPLSTIANESQTSLADQISQAPLFYQNLKWIGPTPPGEAENLLLQTEEQKIRKGGFPPSVPAFEHFLSAYPSSAWGPSL